MWRWEKVAHCEKTFAQGFEKTVKELITTDTSEETIPHTSKKPQTLFCSCLCVLGIAATVFEW